jgi:glyoxylase-like metal-dependent hydrolase (beta-lactamase superfamily II)
VTRLLGLAVVALLVACGSAPPPAPPSPPSAVQIAPRGEHDVALDRLAAGVWMHTSWSRLPDGTWFPANGLVVAERDGLILIDTAWGAENTEQLLALIAREIGRPVRYAVATHAHDDRVGGAAVLQAHSIGLLVTDATRALAAKEMDDDVELVFVDSLGDLEVGVGRMVGPVEIFFPGHGHSSDNVTVWVPDARILFGGCAVKDAASRGLGNVADADLSTWPAAIERLQQRYLPLQVVPGHGASGGPELLAHTLSLIVAARAKVPVKAP